MEREKAEKAAKAAAEAAAAAAAASSGDHAVEPNLDGEAEQPSDE